MALRLHCLLPVSADCLRHVSFILIAGWDAVHTLSMGISGQHAKSHAYPAFAQGQRLGDHAC